MYTHIPISFFEAEVLAYCTYGGNLCSYVKTAANYRLEIWSLSL
jgi:hypothetical protein